MALFKPDHDGLGRSAGLQKSTMRKVDGKAYRFDLRPFECGMSLISDRE